MAKLSNVDCHMEVTVTVQHNVLNVLLCTFLYWFWLSLVTISFSVLAPAWLNVTKFNSPHSYFSIMFHNDLSDQGNYLSSWVTEVKDKARRDLPASD